MSKAGKKETTRTKTRWKEADASDEDSKEYP